MGMIYIILSLNMDFISFIRCKNDEVIRKLFAPDP